MWQQLGLLKGKKKIFNRDQTTEWSKRGQLTPSPVQAPGITRLVFVRMNFERSDWRREEGPFHIRLVLKLATGKTVIASQEEDEPDRPRPLFPFHFTLSSLIHHLKAWFPPLKKTNTRIQPQKDP